jgi:hypothetical protein
MIDKKTLAAAAREIDKYAESEEGFRRWCLEYDIDMDALTYVSSQTALRAAMASEGQDSRLLPMDRLSQIDLKPETEALLHFFTGCVLNGICIGMTVKNEREVGQGGKRFGK